MFKKTLSLALVLAIAITLFPTAGGVRSNAAEADDDEFYMLYVDTLAKYNGTGGAVIIPDYVRHIGAVAFADCTSLTSITIPDSVITIGVEAFSGCTSLTEVVIPDSVNSIGPSAFLNCTALTKVKISNNVSMILSETFGNCFALTTVSIPSSITRIDDYAFFNCNSLLSVTIPGTITAIGTYALGRGMTTDGTVGWLPDFIIYGEKGSAAEKYADENRITFNTIGTGLVNFTKTATYTPGQFTDLVANSWYKESDIQRAYELGLMEGTDGKFNPTGNITIAGTVALAAKIHSIYNGTQDEIDTSLSPWYQGFVNYCVKSGIIQDNIKDYNATAERGFFAGVLANALPKEALPAINKVAEIPDVPVSGVAWYKDNIYTLYNAGIMSGNDKYGTFAPTGSITRAGISVIVAKLVDKSLRSTFTLEKSPAKIAAEKAAADKAAAEALTANYYKDYPTVPDFGKFSGTELISAEHQVSAKGTKATTYKYGSNMITLIDSINDYKYYLEREGFNFIDFVDDAPLYQKDKIQVWLVVGRSLQIMVIDTSTTRS